MPNHQFLDQELHKPREIDLQTGTYLPIPYREPWEDRETFHELRIELVMECKHDPEGAWIFFYPADDCDLELELPIRYYPSIGQLFAFHADMRALALDEADLRRHHYFRTLHKSRSFFEPVLKSNESTGKAKRQPGKLYTAVNTVIKAAVAAGADRDMPSFGQDLDGQQWSVTSVYYPVIVWDGRMFACTIAHGEPELEEVQEVQLLYDYPLERRGLPLTFQSFLIDVIHRDALGAFVDMVMDEHRNLVDRLGRDVGLFERALGAAGPSLASRLVAGR